MTDTAQPLPDEQYDEGGLTPAQRQRAAALDVARAALISRTGLFGGQQVGSSFSVGDLLTVADWVLGNPDAADIQPALAELPITAQTGWAAPLD